MLAFQIFISNLAGASVMIPVIAIICGGLYLNQKQKESYKVFFSTVTAMVVTYTLKYITDIPRPLHALVLETDARFPSGHATLAAVVMSLGIYYAYTHIDTKLLKYAIYTLSILWFIAVSYSRLYLHVHYSIDVITGGLIGIIGTFLVIKFFHHVHYYQD